MAATLEKTKSKSSKISENEVLELLFSKVEKPQDIMKISCVNVYDSNYRVNIWQSLNHPFLKSAGFICASYFFSVDDHKIKIK